MPTAWKLTTWTQRGVLLPDFRLRTCWTLEELVDAAIAITSADVGNIQLLDRLVGMLSTHLLGYSVVMRDVTQMRLAQEELAHRGESLERLVSERTDALEQATKRLRLSERMASLGTLAAGLGHDLGNLLLPLDVRLQLLGQADLPPHLREHVAGIESCVHYLRRLSGGLRLLATNPATPQPLDPTELGGWWQEAGLLLKNVLPPGAVFESDIKTGECWVGIGRVALIQAVFNLLQNAADALGGRGSGRVRVAAEDDPSADVVIVRVSDNGTGMTDDVVRRCMEPYFSTKARGVSTGTGLALIRALATAAGGRVEIESTIAQTRAPMSTAMCRQRP